MSCLSSRCRNTRGLLHNSGGYKRGKVFRVFYVAREAEVPERKKMRCGILLAVLAVVAMVVVADDSPPQPEEPNAPDANCQLKCLMSKHRRPICGSNGQTYANLCDLEMDRFCGNLKDLSVNSCGSCTDPVGEYTRVFRKVLLSHHVYERPQKSGFEERFAT
ncbi:hypothetical protein E2C01_071234 [Portunus trituberculatus]|uniref:Kazal-like domain-containing protein n=1 Tax=Portunus trituberculatus TaxID=210409 RepID=A0A5B7HZF9_PORTR|nr:hypothetical protein [Portunus trituberculatus]